MAVDQGLASLYAKYSCQQKMPEGPLALSTLTVEVPGNQARMQFQGTASPRALSAAFSWAGRTSTSHRVRFGSVPLANRRSTERTELPTKPVRPFAGSFSLNLSRLLGAAGMDQALVFWLFWGQILTHRRPL